jgi:hypothetical protein
LIAARPYQYPKYQEAVARDTFRKTTDFDPRDDSQKVVGLMVPSGCAENLTARKA